MKRKNGLLPVLLLAWTLAFGAASGENAEMTKLSTLPACEWQKSAGFPDWKDYTDDTLAMNSMFSFQFFHGQGQLYLEVSPEVERFVLYVNGTKLDTGDVDGGIWEVDISRYALDGTNTLQISNILPLGLEKPVRVYIPYPVVLDGEGDLQGIRPEALQLLDDLVASDVAWGFPSAQLAVVRNGRLVYEKAWGRVRAYNEDGTENLDSPMADTDTMYDLASVTKMFSAMYAVQKLVSDGLLDPDARIVDILGPEFADNTLDLGYAKADLETQKAWKRSLTVRDILCHEAGFNDVHLYNDPDYDMRLLSTGLPGCNVCYATNREETLQAIFKTPLRYEPHTRTLYSDIDYMLATFIVEKITGTRLDQYVKDTFYAPMGLEHLTFVPLENGFSRDDCAATELQGNTREGHVFFKGIRTETLQGEVHDERAYYCMEGVSGHAGLFGSASDLARLASAMLTGGYGAHRFFSRNVLDLFTAPKSASMGQWGLGWWRQGDDQRPWYFGTQAASSSIGHQGWTGTLAMIDPSRNLTVAYLTNSIHSPLYDNEKYSHFNGGRYTASTLGFVPQILSIGMDGDRDVTAQLLDLLADMTAESLKLIPDHAGGDHPNVKNTLSKAAVLRKWAEKAGNEEYVQFAERLAERWEQR